MRHLDLLGTGLKSDFLCDLFETYDVQVVYEYDRTHEGLADEYHAELPDLGLQFVFDAKQVLRTLFLRPVEVSTLNPFNPDDDRIQRFHTRADAIREAHENGLQFSEGMAELMGEQKDWIRFKSDTHSIHYEFVDSELRLITLQAVSEK